MTGMKRSKPKKVDIMREVLDASLATARESIEHAGPLNGKADPPHYIFAFTSELYNNFQYEASKPEADSSALWQELLGVYEELYKRFKYKRIGDALVRLREIAPFSDEAQEYVDDIVEELLEVEDKEPGQLRRRIGTTRLKYRSICPKMYVSKDPPYILVGERKYEFTAYEQWCVLDRILRFIYRHYNPNPYDTKSYSLRLTSAEINKFHDKRLFIDRYVIRARKSKDSRRNNRDTDENVSINYRNLEKDMAE